MENAKFTPAKSLKTALSRKLIPAKSLVKLNAGKLIPAKSSVKPNFAKINSREVSEKNSQKLIPPKISSLKVYSGGLGRAFCVRISVFKTFKSIKYPYHMHKRAFFKVKSPSLSFETYLKTL